jgi:hypothetical protein
VPDEGSRISFRDALSDAIRYWERGRLLYNGALLLVVLVMFFAAWPVSRRVIELQSMLVLFVLAVLAIVAYCAAYVPDLVLQLSSFRDSWLRVRWILLTVGLLMGCALAFLFVAGPFGLAQGNW